MRPEIAVVPFQRYLSVPQESKIIFVGLRQLRIHVREHPAGAGGREIRYEIVFVEQTRGDALGIVVFVPAGGSCYRNDGLQSLYAGSRHLERHGAGIGSSGHADAAAAPVRRDLDVVFLVGIGLAVAREPFRDAAERVCLRLAAAAFQAFGAPGAQTCGLHDGIASYEIIIVGR